MLQPTTAANDGFRSRAPRPGIYLCYSHLGSKVEFRISMGRMEKLAGLSPRRQSERGEGTMKRFLRLRVSVSRCLSDEIRERGRGGWMCSMVSTFFDSSDRKTCLGTAAGFRYIQFLCRSHPRQSRRCPCELRAHELPSGVGVEREAEIKDSAQDPQPGKGLVGLSCVWDLSVPTSLCCGCG